MLANEIRPIDYHERIVAFIDVLGFAELVKASDAEPAKRAKIGKLISADKLFEQFVGNALPVITGQGTFFSDSFVLSMSADRVIYMIREAGYLCRRLLQLGFPCRGAIVAGSLYHRERIVVGPAFVKAHQLEQSIAIYPRIILDDAAMALWRSDFKLDESGQGPAHFRYEALVKRDRDGQHFLDIFSPLWTSFVPWTDVVQSVDSVPATAADFLISARKSIQEGLAEHKGNEKVLAKYAWLATEANERASSLGLEENSS